MRKIAIFLTSFNAGGLERVFVNYANRLIDFCEITIISCNSFGELRKEIDKRIHIEILDDSRLRKSPSKLLKVLKKSDYDVVFTGGDSLNCVLILVSFFLNNSTKIIISQHNYNNIEQQKSKFWNIFGKKIMHVLYPHADCVIAVSDGIKDYLINSIQVPAAKICTVYNGINCEEIIARSEDNSVAVPDYDYVLYMGRLSIVKNIPHILRSFEKANLGNVHLIILGSGEEKEELQRVANALTKRELIHFVGAVSNPFPLLKNARALLMASFSEACPMVVLESLALNVPVVTTPASGPVEMLKDFDKAIITESFDNIDEYAECIQSAVKEDGFNAKQIVEKYEMKKSLDQLLGLIKSN